MQTGSNLCPGYPRTGQTTDNLLQELRAVALAVAGGKWYTSTSRTMLAAPCSGNSWPEFDEMCKSAVRREFDVVTAWSVDRLGRSLQHLVRIPGCDPCVKGVPDLYLHQ